MTKVKICGIRREEDVKAVNELLPDYIGFVLVPSSRRFVDHELLETLSPGVDGRIVKVGVFLDSPLSDILRVLDEKLIDIAQLHGCEDAKYIEEVQKRGCQVIKSFTLDELEEALSSPADFLLFDYKVPGSGQVIDYSRLSGIKRDYFLAGGVGSDNCEMMIRTLHPYALDASSKMERDGWKDYDLMKEFIRKVKETSL